VSNTKRPFRIRITNVPAIHVGVIATLTLEIINLQEKEIIPKITIDNPKTGFFIEGIAHQTLGQIEAMGTKEFQFKILPEEKGFHILDSIKIEDLSQDENSPFRVCLFKNIMSLLIQ